MQLLYRLLTLCLLSNAFQERVIYRQRISGDSYLPSIVCYGTERSSPDGLDGASAQSVPFIAQDVDFHTLVTKSTIFADKSLFIKDIIEDSSTTLLLAMPRRWGKTVNLDMLRRFLTIPVDDRGKRVNDSWDTDNYKLFAGGQIDVDLRGRRTLSPLRISGEKLFNTTEALKAQGTYPVIYIDFKDCKADRFSTVCMGIKRVLKDCFSSHSYLKESARLDEEEQALAKKYMGAISSKQLDEDEIKSGLRFLSEMLFRHYGRKKVWVLVDEYDAVANQAYRKFSGSDLEAMIDLFSGIYETSLKSNPYLEKGVLTGVQYIAQSGMLSGLNNLGKFDFTNAKYAQHYGLDQDEIDLFFTHFEVPESLSIDAKRWYNGYKVPKYRPVRVDSPTNEMIDKYNIWSIVKYLNSKHFSAFESHWGQSGNVDFLDDLFIKPEIKQAIAELVNDKSIPFVRRDDFSAGDFKTLKTMLGGNQAVTPDGLTVLLSYLFMGGYLTLDETASDYYRLPNMEIKYEMERRLIKYYETVCKLDFTKMQKTTGVLQRLMDVKDSSWHAYVSLLRDFYDQFKGIIQSIERTNNPLQEGIFMNEDLVHTLLNYIALQTQHATFGSELYTKTLYAEREDKEGTGRADIKITKGDVGLIMEVKCVGIPRHGDKHMEKAIKQAMNYTDLLPTPKKIFIAINVEKTSAHPEEGAIELLCAYNNGPTGWNVLGFNATKDPDIFGVSSDMVADFMKVAR